MIRITYEYYCTDYDRQHKLIKTFTDLKDLEDWIFDEAVGDISDYRTLFFPQSEPSHIRIKLGYKFGYRQDYYIHIIESEKGIILSDGYYTANQKHWSKEVKEWLKHCEEKRHNPKFNFVD